MLEKIVLPLGDLADGGNFMFWLRRYRREQWLSADRLREIQRERLAQMLAFARTKVPFYRDLPPPLADPFADLKQFPIIRKSDIRAAVEQMLTQPKAHLIAESSSGSSGVQGTVYVDKSAQASQRAIQMLWFEWSGYRIGDSILQTGITPNRGIVKGLKDFLLDTDYIPAFTLSAEIIRAILQKLEKNPRRYLFGYASSLYVLAQTALEMNFRTIRFKCAVSWGDKLFPHYREKIRQAFGCQTLDTYGCTEGAMIGAECRHGKYHLAVNQCHIETVDEEGLPAADGATGKVLATRLDNFAMPLIRYYLGDIAELETVQNTVCECGRQSPLLRRVIGRDTDIVRTKLGKQMIVHFFTGIFEHVPQIRQFKVVQKTLDGIEIHFIPGDDFEAHLLTVLENKMNEHLGEKFPVQWIETDLIAPTGSGKPQIVQSFLNQSLTH